MSKYTIGFVVAAVLVMGFAKLPSASVLNQDSIMLQFCIQKYLSKNAKVDGVVLKKILKCIKDTQKEGNTVINEERND